MPTITAHQFDHLREMVLRESAIVLEPGQPRLREQPNHLLPADLKQIAGPEWDPPDQNERYADVHQCVPGSAAHLRP